MNRILNALLLACLLALCATAQKSEGSRLASFKRYYPKYSSPADRAEAVHTLQGCDEPGVFEVLYPKLSEKGLEPEVAREIVAVFAKFPSEAQQRQVLDALQAEKLDAPRLALLDALAQAQWKEAAAALPPLLADKSAEVRARVLTLLGPDQSALATQVAALCEDASEFVRFEALDALARFRSVLVVPRAIAALDHPLRQVRQSAIRALALVRDRSSVEPLVLRMQKEQGVLLVDLAEALAGLTGKEFGPDPAQWRQWWSEQNKETYQLPALAGIAYLRGQRAARSGGVGWEGPPTKPGDPPFHVESTSRRMIFVIDCSGSMATLVAEKERYEQQKPADFSRMEIVKSELIRVIDRLTPEASFNIIAFGTDVDAWRASLQPALITQKSSAKDWVRGLRPIESLGKGKTNTFGALERALGGREVRTGEKSEPDTLFFLSDGLPTCGDYVDPADILREVRTLNERRRMVIHTLAIGQFEKDFMKRLAEQNGPGQFVDLGN